MRARTRDLSGPAGLVLPSLPRAAAVFGIALLYEVLLMLARSNAGWHPLALSSQPVLLVLNAAAAAVLVELLLRGLLQGLLPYLGIGAMLSLAIPAVLELFGGYAGADVAWEAAFGVGFVFARSASGSVIPCMVLRFVQYLIVPAFVAVHR
ncbi:CPBP family intramembrane metalloprotease [bacterium]|nr:MAG: CPBP family intramembrane metalloprotease [bacterium]